MNISWEWSTSVSFVGKSASLTLASYLFRSGRQTCLTVYMLVAQLAVKNSNCICLCTRRLASPRVTSCRVVSLRDPPLVHKYAEATEQECGEVAVQQPNNAIAQTQHFLLYILLIVLLDFHLLKWIQFQPSWKINSFVVVSLHCTLTASFPGC